MAQLAERLWPYVVSAALTFAWWRWLGHPFPVKPEGLLAASGGASAVLVGFLATAKTVLLAITSADVFKRLKDGGFTQLLFGYLFEALYGGMAVLVVSVAGFFVIGQNGQAPVWFSLLWVAGATLALALFIRITNLLFKLLHWV